MTVDSAIYRAAIKELIDSWPSASHGGLDVRGVGGRQGATLGSRLTVWGLAAHVHHLAPVAVEMVDRGLGLVAAPLMRSMFEAAVTAHWLLQFKEADVAFQKEHVRQRRNLISTVTDAGLVPTGRPAPELDEDEKQLLATPLNASARHFDQVCDDLQPGGTRLYSVYATLSRYSHAGLPVADLYVQERDDPQVPVALRQVPRGSVDEGWLWIVAASLVWAGSAIDWIDANKTRRSQLKRVATAIEVPFKFQISDEAWVRENKPRGVS